MGRWTPLLAAVALLAGCGGVSQQSPAAETASARQEAPAPAAAPASGGMRLWAPASVPASRTCVPGEERRLGSRRVAYAAEARRPTVAFARPGRRALARFGLVNQNGFPTFFGVVGVVVDSACAPRWYRVRLPVRPNGATGYVAARGLALIEVRTRIEIDLSERRLDFFRDGKLLYRLTAAVGAPGTPTPTGSYYVNQRIRPGDPRGPWGPAALGISAFSPVLTTWAQGGPIAIHGTNDPSSIGRPASHGCVRLDNVALLRIYRRTPAGTPVVIRA